MRAQGIKGSSCCFNKCKTHFEYSCGCWMIPFVVATSLATSSPVYLENESNCGKCTVGRKKIFFERALREREREKERERENFTKYNSENCF